MPSTIRVSLWLLALGAGLAAGLLSWAAGEWTYPRFKMRDAIVLPANYYQTSGYQRQALHSEVMGRAHAAVERKRTTATFGFLGLVLGTALGLIGGLVAGFRPGAVAGAVAGGIVAGAVGAGLSWIVTPVYFQYLDPEQGFLALFLARAAIFMPLGAAAGLALGLGLYDRATFMSALCGGLAGALLGTIALESAISISFPLLPTFEVIPTGWPSRLITHLCVAAFTAAMAGLAAAKPVKKLAPSPAACP
jgi:hypothetical protein